MSTSSTSPMLGFTATVGNSALRYLPEPATKGVGVFRDVLNLAKSVGEEVVGGVDTVATGSFGELIQVQIDAQKELQSTTMVSNVEKSKHESKMSAIRNIRVS